MTRNNTVYLVVGVLVVVVAVLGYLLYQNQNQGVSINIGPGGASIQTK